MTRELCPKTSLCYPSHWLMVSEGVYINIEGGELFAIDVTEKETPKSLAKVNGHKIKRKANTSGKIKG